MPLTAAGRLNAARIQSLGYACIAFDTARPDRLDDRTDIDRKPISVRDNGLLAEFLGLGEVAGVAQPYALGLFGR